jgi:hypothetical protein
MVAARESPVFLLCLSAALRAKARRLRVSAQRLRLKLPPAISAKPRPF